MTDDGEVTKPCGRLEDLRHAMKRRLIQFATARRFFFESAAIPGISPVPFRLHSANRVLCVPFLIKLID
jgi:hypothetical protein